MKIQFKDITKEKPKDRESCLINCKHGIVEAIWREKEGSFVGYYWQDIYFGMCDWISISEIDIAEPNHPLT